MAPRTSPSGWRGLLRARWVWAIAGVAIAAVGVAGFYAWTLWQAAVSDQCRVLPDPELSLAEMIALKGRHEAWQSNGDPEARLALEPRELSFLMQGRFSFDLALEAVGDAAHLQLAVPTADGHCWNIDYRGRIRVHDGVATLEPDQVLVGEADLTRLVGREVTWRAEDMPDERARALLENTELAEFSGGNVEVLLVDRWKRW